MLMPKAKAKKRACCFCGDLFKPNGMKKHIHSCSAVPAAFRPEMIPPLYFMVRTDSLNKGGAQEGGAKPKPAAAKKKPVPPAPEEDKDSSTGHEGDDSEDAETANKGDKGPTPNSKRRVSTPGEIDDDDVRRSKRPHRRSEDVEALIQAETHHPRSSEKTAKAAAALKDTFEPLATELADSQTAADAIFSAELQRYSEAASEKASEKDDAGHTLWVAWRTDIDHSFVKLRKFLQLRHGQLLATAEGHKETARPPHTAFRKTEPPEGAHCRSAADLQAELDELDAQIDEVTATSFS